ncbi:hypothetical protein DFH07DRAFT_833267 [Mycena maculata]|uniref:Uncharacterized protein n=1 Tax=Mycena maculata TaxID=230809 RepID=A0AAD7ILA5_9AGAR|nr:hypothetical protein DFH07DRAFT_833267 [Mycena maculata]
MNPSAGTEDPYIAAQDALQQAQLAFSNLPRQHAAGDDACSRCESLSSTILTMEESNQRELQAVVDERDVLRKECERLRARVAALDPSPDRLEGPGDRGALRLKPAAFDDAIGTPPESPLSSLSHDGRLNAQRQEEEESSSVSVDGGTASYYRRDYEQDQGSARRNRRGAADGEPPRKRQRASNASEADKHRPRPRLKVPYLVLAAAHPRKSNSRLLSAFGVKLPPILTDGDAYNFELPDEVVGVEPEPEPSDEGESEAEATAVAEDVVPPEPKIRTKTKATTSGSVGEKRDLKRGSEKKTEIVVGDPHPLESPGVYFTIKF